MSATIACQTCGRTYTEQRPADLCRRLDLLAFDARKVEAARDGRPEPRFTGWWDNPETGKEIAR